LTSWTGRFDDRDDVTAEEREAYQASVRPGDVLRFKDMTEGLPLEIMYGLGPHSIRIIEEVLEITKPCSILEIGFGAGASASLFLSLSTASLASCEISHDTRVLTAADMLMRSFPGRFRFMNFPSYELSDQHFKTTGAPDLIFIDGSHEYEEVANDLAFAIGFIPWILLDDWWPHFGPGVQRAAKERPELERSGHWGNLILFRTVTP
jgi:predicted O-methyltransferase YrrM